MEEHGHDVQDRFEAAYERLKRPVLRRARRWFPSLSEADLEDAYQAAWLSVVRTETAVLDIDAYVYAAMRSQALMELRRRRRRPVAPLTERSRRSEFGTSDGGLLIDEPIDEAAVSPEESAHTRAMGAWARDLLEELSPRQSSVVTLRWGWGLSRREIAGLLELSERTVKRDLELSGRRLSEGVEELGAGRWCERRRSLVTAYALGLLSPARITRAEVHLRACSGCRGLVHDLRRRAQELAAVAPAPVLMDAPARTPLGAVSEALDDARAQFSDLAASAKHQAVSLSARASDPTPLAGARPGALAAAVAGCLAVGSGAYCAVQGTVPEPLRFGALSQQSASTDGSEAPSEPTETNPDPSPLQDDPAPVEPIAPESAPDPIQPPPTEAPAPPAPEPSQDFFGSEPSAAPEAQSAGLGSAASAPAPAAPRSEFDGP